MKNIIFISSLLVIVLSNTINTMEQTFTYDKSLCLQGCEALVLHNLSKSNNYKTLAQVCNTLQNVENRSLIGNTPQTHIKTPVPALVQQVPQLCVMAEAINYPHIQKLKTEIISVAQKINALGYQINCGIYSLQLKTQVIARYQYPMEQILTFFPIEKHVLAQEIETRNQLVQLLGQLNLELEMFQKS